MTILEYIASQLDREVTEDDIKFGKQFIIDQLDYWNFCLECKRLLIDGQLAKEEKNAANK